MPRNDDRGIPPPSPWVVRHGGMIPPGGVVLDVACGSGRHGRFFRSLGHPVVLLDRDIMRIADMASDDGVEIVARDLEGGRPWPLPGRQFAGVIVVTYLPRPILSALVPAVAPGGAMISDPFAVGHEASAQPPTPDLLLRRSELRKSHPP